MEKLFLGSSLSKVGQNKKAPSHLLGASFNDEVDALVRWWWTVLECTITEHEINNIAFMWL